MSRLVHNVFNVGYNGIAKELCSSADIRDSITGRTLNLQRVIWDTGATNSVLNVSIPPKLGLIPTGQALVGSANGDAIVNTYVIDLVLPYRQVTILSLNVSDGKLPHTDEMLIGMDVIGLGDFTVQNYDGKTHFSFCIPPFEKKYGMVEKATKINERGSKRKRP